MRLRLHCGPNGYALIAHILIVMKKLNLLAPILALASAAAIAAAGSVSRQTKAGNAVNASVVRVENRGLLFTDNSAGVTGTDAGYSIQFRKQALWLFGDVFLQDSVAPAKPYVGAVSNCALLAPRSGGVAALRQYRFLTDPATGLARQVLPLQPGEGKDVRLWPFGGWYDAHSDRVNLFYARVRVTGSGPLDFHVDGYGLAQSQIEPAETIHFARIPAGPNEDLWWTGANGEPVFGSAVVSGSRDGYVYVVGFQQRGATKVGKLARVPRDQATDRGAYVYYAGGDAAPHWTRDISASADVEGLAGFPSELSVAWNPFLGGFLAVHSIGLTDRARLSVASAPWGPYRAIAEIGTPKRALSSAFCYAAKEHPELAEDRARIIYVTYVDSGRYWLELLKVTLQKD